MTILVTGATGTIGREVLAHLDGEDVDVRALARSSRSATLPAGVEPVAGDLADLDSVRQALVGIDTLFLLVPNVADELTQAMLTLANPHSRWGIAALHATLAFASRPAVRGLAGRLFGDRSKEPDLSR